MNRSAEPQPLQSALPKLQPLLEYLDALTGPADLATLRKLLEELDITRADLAPACEFDDADYRRIFIKDSKWYEVVCICWKSGQRTPIHDHKGASCAFRVIDGIATETRFERSPSGLVYPTSTEHQEPGYVCASSEADIHQVANIQGDGAEMINLHIYSPPLRHFNVYSLDTRTADDPKAMRPNDLKFAPVGAASS